MCREVSKPGTERSAYLSHISPAQDCGMCSQQEVIGEGGRSVDECGLP